jgi:hypothetical protein
MYTTSQLIDKLKVGQIAQLIDVLDTPSNYLTPLFDNPYCVTKFADGSIRWLKGVQGYLMMSPFIVNDARWIVK